MTNTTPQPLSARSDGPLPTAALEEIMRQVRISGSMSVHKAERFYATITALTNERDAATEANGLMREQNDRLVDRTIRLEGERDAARLTIGKLRDKANLLANLCRKFSELRRGGSRRDFDELEIQMQQAMLSASEVEP